MTKKQPAHRVFYVGDAVGTEETAAPSSDARQEALDRSGHIASPSRRSVYVEGFIAGAEWEGAQYEVLIQEARQLSDDHWSECRCKLCSTLSALGIESSDEGEADGIPEAR